MADTGSNSGRADLPPLPQAGEGEDSRALSRRRLRRLGLVPLLVLGVALGAAGVRAAQAPPEGPEPIAYDRAACAHCHMSVGDPRFAAQLQTAEGQVLNFDDPGCLLRYLEAERPQVQAAYFHHLREARWLTAAQAGFVAAGPTPMGYGLGAVDRAAPGALSLEDAQAKLAARADGRTP